MRTPRNVLLCAVMFAAVASGTPVPAAVPSSYIEATLFQEKAPVKVLARFAESVPSIRGLEVHYRFHSVPAVFATATPAAIEALAERTDLVALERDHAIEHDLDSATVASRAREVWGNAQVTDAQGQPVDGRGVGIAIVDTGLDGLHPDFQVEGKVKGNYLVTPAGMASAPWTASTRESHGTHVAGIAAGNGLSSGGRYMGVAPGASLYSFQNSGSVALAAIAFDWILENGASQDPPIKVVNNSWHCSSAACTDPSNTDHLHHVLTSMLAESGIVVTWAAGNKRGDGDVATTTLESRIRTPGVISVANYKDDDSGGRDRCLSGASSWGSSYDPTTWPDVAAPGRSIMSTWAVDATISGTTYAGRNPVTGSNSYREATGTSMAAPHVAGIVALVRQANPSLSPAEIEYIVKQTATPIVGPPGPGQDGCGIGVVRADPAHPWHAANYAAGHGLVDARAAVDLALSWSGMPPWQSPEPIPDEFVVMRRGFEAAQTFYLVGDDRMSTAYPDATTPRMRVYDSTQTVVHTSDPLESPATFDAVRSDLYVGTSSEHGEIYSYIGRGYVQGDVERVAADGSSETIASASNFMYSSNTMNPLHRDLLTFLPEPVTLQAGDRIRVRISYAAELYRGIPLINQLWNVYTEGTTPSRVELGTAVARPVPGTRAFCERRDDCAMVDATHPHEGLRCPEVVFRLRWEGPAGSSIALNCNNIIYTCPVVDAPEGRNGTCETRVDATDPVGTADLGASCTYRMPDGARGGRGTCEALAVDLDD